MDWAVGADEISEREREGGMREAGAGEGGGAASGGGAVRERGRT